MFMTNKEILEQANKAISMGDFEGFLIHCTDNTVWNFLGDRSIRGKEAVRNWMREIYKIPPEFNVRQMIAEGDFVVALGDIAISENGKKTNQSYCDVWRLEGGYLAELNAYVVKNNKSSLI